MVYGAGNLLALMAYATSGWTAVFFIRYFGWSAPTAGVVIDAAIIVSGVIQGPLSGFTSDALAKRFVGGRIFLVPAFVAIALPFAVAWLLAITPFLALGLLILSNIFGNSALYSIPTMVQELTPNKIRGFCWRGVPLRSRLLVLVWDRARLLSSATSSFATGR